MPDGLRTARHFLWGTPSVKTNGSRLGEFRELPPQALRASSPKGTPLRYAGNFTATTKSRPLGEGGIAAGDDGRGDFPAAPAG